MSASSDLQCAIEGILGLPGCLRVSVPIVKRRPKSLPNDIEAAAANHGLCIFVMPPLPTSALQGNPFVFFDKAEIRVRVVEQVALNDSGADAYDLIDDIANALHWQPSNALNAAVAAAMAANSALSESEALAQVKASGALAPMFDLGAILDAPLQLAPHPAEMVEDPSTRIIDVIFEAVYGFQPATN